MTGNKAPDVPAPADAGEKRASFSRRTLVTGAVGVAALLAVGGVGKAVAGERTLLRPPGAQDEARLLGACIKCDRCRSVCPENVIDVAHLEDGFVNARTPKMNFHRGYCTFCEGEYRCVTVCPTSAIAFGFDEPADKIGVAAIDTEQCLLFRSGSGKCSRECVAACAYGALSTDDAGRIVVDEAKCNGCGACEYECPSASYGSFTGSERRGINVEPWEGGRR